MIDFTDSQKDALTEFVNIGVGKAAAVLNEMVGAHVTLQAPTLTFLTPDTRADVLSRLGDEELAAVEMGFTGVLSGIALLAFPVASADVLVALLTGEQPDSPYLESMKIETLNEVGNIVINGVMGSIGNMLTERLDYSVPVYRETTFGRILGVSRDTDAVVLLAEALISLKEHSIAGEIVIIFELGSFQELLSGLDKLS